jgi:hypothetical protein
MRLLSLVFLFCYYPKFLFSQEQINHVPNSSFESSKDLPGSYSQSNLLNIWYSCRINCDPVTYFNSSSFNPRKIVGRNQLPHSGNAFIGLGIDLKSKLRYSQFIEAPLSKPLIKDSIYEITLYACLGEDFKYNVDHLECSFFQRKFLYTTKINFDKNEIISLIPDQELIKDPAKWTKFAANYKATGDENYLVLGNFSFSYKRKKQPFKFTLLHFITRQATYYLIDDVSIVEAAKPRSNIDDTTYGEFH